MKKIFKLSISFICIMFMLILGLNTLSAATFSVSTTSATLYVGNSTTVTVSAPGVAGGPFVVTSSNSAVATVSGLNGGWLEDNSGTITITGKSKGTATITILATVANLEDSSDESTVTKTVTVTVKEKEVTPTEPTKPTTPTVTKSSDATLKALKVNIEGLSPSFNKNTYVYTLSVGSDINSIKVTASTNNSKAKYYVSGNTNLEYGDNNVWITVTAENGTTKSYKIIVTKAENPEKANAYLQNIIVNNAKLNEEFNRQTLEYTLQDVEYDVESIDMSIFPENIKATFKVEGNENLKVGENVIKIKVTAEDKKTTKEYTIKVNKKEKIVTEQPYEEQNSMQDLNTQIENAEEENASIQRQLLVLVYILSVVEFLEIVYLFIQLRNKKEDDTEFELNNVPKRKRNKDK